MNNFNKFRQVHEGFDVSPPGAYSNLLGYQSVNVIDPSFSEFIRNFIVDDYYLIVYGTKLKNLVYSVQYTKVYADGRTIWYTEPLTLDQINELFDYLENQDRRTEKKLESIEAAKRAFVDLQIAADETTLKKFNKSAPVRLQREYLHAST